MSEVRQQIVPDSRSSCTEGSVAEVGPRPIYRSVKGSSTTDELSDDEPLMTE